MLANSLARMLMSCKCPLSLACILPKDTLDLQLYHIERISFLSSLSLYQWPLGLAHFIRFHHLCLSLLFNSLPFSFSFSRFFGLWILSVCLDQSRQSFPLSSLLISPTSLALLPTLSLWSFLENTTMPLANLVVPWNIKLNEVCLVCFFCFLSCSSPCNSLFFLTRSHPHRPVRKTSLYR